MRVTSKGQVTIPAAIREELGLLPGTEVRCRVSGDTAILEKVRGPSRRGTRLIGRLRGSATVRMTTDQILALTRES